MKAQEEFAKTVRVSIPASVASNIGSLKKSYGTILDKLGCPACCSGHDIYLELQREHVFEKGLESYFATRGARAKVAAETAAPLTVTIQPEFASNIENVFKAIDRIAEITGHSACATGCDIHFNLEQQLVLNEKLNIDERIMSVR